MKQAMTPQQQQLYDKVIVLDDSACWMWQGQVSNSGYGRLKQVQDDDTVQMVSAQSASYRAFIDKVPDGCLVKQQCGNRLCINPAHLELIEV
jgi:Schitoviridae HNH endonuclease